MVIGNGLIANAFTSFKCEDKFILFASGVSNSNEFRLKEFDKEKKLISNTINNYPDKTLIYFSTCAFYDKFFSESKYLKHKKDIESYITNNVQSYYIFRIPQLIGSNNEMQLLGFINSKIKQNLKFDLFDIERNLIDLEFLKKSVTYIVKSNLLLNQIINISYPQNIRVKEIVEIFEIIYNKPAIYDVKQLEGSFKITNIDLINQIFNELELIKEDYYEIKLKEYYG